MGEQLWTPLSNANTQPILNHLSYEGKYEDMQKYWIASNALPGSIINGKGVVSFSVTASETLPVLCSNSTNQDTSSRWQVTVYSNNETLIGRVLKH